MERPQPQTEERFEMDARQPGMFSTGELKLRQRQRLATRQRRREEAEREAIEAEEAEHDDPTPPGINDLIY